MRRVRRGKGENTKCKMIQEVREKEHKVCNTFRNQNNPVSELTVNFDIDTGQISKHRIIAEQKQK